MQGYTEGETGRLKAKYGKLWDLDANDISDIHHLILRNVEAGIPSLEISRPCHSKDFQNDEMDPNVAPSDLQKVPSACLEWQPQSIAQFLARRSGIDFCEDDCVAYESAESVPTITTRLSIICGDAKLVSTYAHVESLLNGDSVELVLLDPPFGLDKHGQNETWDSADQKWTPSGDILSYLEKVPLRPTFCLGVYCQVEDIGKWVEALEPGTSKTGPARGHVVMSLNRDMVAEYKPGIQSKGVVVYVVAMKYGNGTEAVSAEMSPLRGRFMYFFAPPQSTSKYGRPEVDAHLRSRQGLVNPTQKSLDETRHLVCTLAPKGGSVLSMCNGMGTALVAAAMEGCHSVGVDLSERQCSQARKRLRVFCAREDKLQRALFGGLLPTHPGTRALTTDAQKGDVPDLQVGPPGHRQCHVCGLRCIAHCAGWSADHVAVVREGHATGLLPPHLDTQSPHPVCLCGRVPPSGTFGFHGFAMANPPPRGHPGHECIIISGSQERRLPNCLKKDARGIMNPLRPADIRH